MSACQICECLSLSTSPLRSGIFNVCQVKDWIFLTLLERVKHSLLFFSFPPRLVDLAVFHQYISQSFNLSHRNTWLSFGGSYSGALSAWFRGKVQDWTRIWLSLYILNNNSLKLICKTAQIHAGHHDCENMYKEVSLLIYKNLSNQNLCIKIWW